MKHVEIIGCELEIRLEDNLPEESKMRRICFAILAEAEGCCREQKKT